MDRDHLEQWVELLENACNVDARDQEPNTYAASVAQAFVDAYRLEHPTRHGQDRTNG